MYLVLGAASHDDAQIGIGSLRHFAALSQVKPRAVRLVLPVVEASRFARYAQILKRVAVHDPPAKLDCPRRE